MSRLTIEQVWQAECQRCANSDQSFEFDEDAARADLMDLGWADDFCPACNGVIR